MLSLENKCALFLSLTSGIFLAGGVIKVDVIENGQLMEWRGDSFDLLVSKRTHEAIRRTNGEDLFKYHMDGMEFCSKISYSQIEGDRWVITIALEKNRIIPPQKITYRLGKERLGNRILGL